MSEAKSPKAQTVTTTSRKKPNFRGTHKFSMPEWALKDTKNQYRWVKESTFTLRTDGIDLRGYEKVRIPAGQEGAGEYLRNQEMVLCSMPKEWHDEKMAVIAEESAAQVKGAIEGAEGFNEALKHQIKKAGGKLDFNMTVGNE